MEFKSSFRIFENVSFWLQRLSDPALISWDYLQKSQQSLWSPSHLKPTFFLILSTLVKILDVTLNGGRSQFMFAYRTIQPKLSFKILPIFPQNFHCLWMLELTIAKQPNRYIQTLARQVCPDQAHHESRLRNVEAL